MLIENWRMTKTEKDKKNSKRGPLGSKKQKKDSDLFL